MKRLSREYPTRNGIPIPSAELELPDTRLNPEVEQSYNNHHKQYYKRMYGQLAIYQTLRDLDRSQEPVPIDQHITLHQWYGPPKLPTIEQAFNQVIEAYDNDEQIRYGSLRLPTYKPITPELIQHLTNEYNQQAA